MISSSAQWFRYQMEEFMKSIFYVIHFGRLNGCENPQTKSGIRNIF